MAQTSCCTCTTTFSAPPRNYIHKCAPFICPAPNLFSKCNTTFKPRLVPLGMAQKDHFVPIVRTLKKDLQATLLKV